MVRSTFTATRERRLHFQLAQSCSRSWGFRVRAAASGRPRPLLPYTDTLIVAQAPGSLVSGTPLLSVIVPTCNSAAFIATSLREILACVAAGPSS